MPRAYLPGRTSFGIDARHPCLSEALDAFQKTPHHAAHRPTAIPCCSSAAHPLRPSTWISIWCAASCRRSTKPDGCSRRTVRPLHRRSPEPEGSARGPAPDSPCPRRSVSQCECEGIAPFAPCRSPGAPLGYLYPAAFSAGPIVCLTSKVEPVMRFPMCADASRTKHTRIIARTIPERRCRTRQARAEDSG